MLEVIGGGTGVKRSASAEGANGQDEMEEMDEDEGPLLPASSIDFASVYRLSDLKKHNDQRMKDDFGIDISPALMTRRKSNSGLMAGFRRSSKAPSENRPVFNESIWVQLRKLCWRNFLELWRSPEFSFQRFVVVTVFMLMFVAIYFQQPLRNAADVQSHILCVSFSMSLVSMFTMMTIIPFSMNRRALFYRERGAGMYHAAVYALSAGFAELPYLFVTSVLVGFFSPGMVTSSCYSAPFG